MAKFHITDERKNAPIRLTRSFRRTLTRRDGFIPENAEKGKVVAIIGKSTIVESVHIEGTIDKYVDCATTGTLISENDDASLLAVGDNVLFLREKMEESIESIPKGSLLKVFERNTEIARISVANKNRKHVIAANIDQVLIMSSCFDPMYNRRLIDRFIVSCELGMVKPALCINKTDLAHMDVIIEDLAVYKEIGIPIFYTSVINDQGIDLVENYLADKMTAIAGQSGSGKSTMITRLIGKDVQEVQEISERTSKGRHTTSFVKMFNLPGGGRIIDSPGVREFGIPNIDKKELSLFYHDFDPYFSKCRYLPCTHIHEPECAVKAAVENEEIDSERYQSYLNLFESLE